MSAVKQKTKLDLLGEQAAHHQRELDKAENGAKKHREALKRAVIEAHAELVGDREFKAWCEEWEVNYETAGQWVRWEKSPEKREAHNAKQRDRARAKAADREKVESSRSPTAPPRLRQGEINEAVMGFKAALRTFWRKKDDRYFKTGLQHLRFCIQQSNLAEVMGMTADEIVDTFLRRE